MTPDPRRRRRIWTVGACAGLAGVVTVWSLTLWPGAAIISGLVIGTVAGVIAAAVYDFAARR